MDFWCTPQLHVCERYSSPLTLPQFIHYHVERYNHSYIRLVIKKNLVAEKSIRNLDYNIL